MDSTQKDTVNQSNQPLHTTPRTLYASNNSDDEETTTSRLKKDDFVSFPTLVEPEIPNNKSITGLISKTLRKVTNNATNLVLNYSAPPESPRQYSSDIIHDAKANQDSYQPQPPNNRDVTPLRGQNTKRIDNKSASNKEVLYSDRAAKFNPSDTESDTRSTMSERRLPEVSNIIPQPPGPRKIQRGPLYNSDTEDVRQISDGASSVESREKGSAQPRWIEPQGKRVADVKAEPQDSNASLGTTSRQLTKDKPITSQPVSARLNKVRNLISDERAPRVRSDNRSLRLSTMPYLNSESLSPRAISSVASVNALATVDLSDTEPPAQVTRSLGELKTNEKKLKRTALSKKISTLFNNLPNDIEVSDDSASDAESDGDLSRIESSVKSNEVDFDNNVLLPSRKDNEAKSISISHGSGVLHGESIAKSTPIKVEGTRKLTMSTLSGDSPTVSSFHAIRNKDEHASRKRSQNFSSLVLDNAKTILNQNLGAVASSASSIVGKKKKKKSTRISQNPLKNGGIPRKYWMDDAFVADCLNCFKPFTAFRRKHHCRFCGQIFCSECTLFISYTQHRDQRNNVVDQKRPYHDKLRVCKPCYSDVIIYLSDESSGSEADEEADQTTDELNHPKSRNEDLLVPNHPLSRVRSLSTTSHRNSFSNHDISQDSIQSTRDSNSINSDSPSRRNGHHLYPDESIKTNSKQAPRMAIPTTRAGESIEIPLMRNSLSNAQFVRGSLNKYGSNSKFEVMDQNSAPKSFQFDLPAHSKMAIHQHPSSNFAQASFDILNSNRAWLKNSESFRNLESEFHVNDGDQSPSYNGLGSRKPSLKLKVTPSFGRMERSSHGFLDRDENDDADTESSTSESEEELHSPRGFRDEASDDEEDERAMSIYSSLNDHPVYGTTPLGRNSSHMFGSSTGAVPTLGEFPGIKSFYSGIRNSLPYSDIIKNKNIGISEATRPESLRSRARANASIQRMRSRRQTRGGRNILILTQNNIRLPSLGTTINRSNPNIQLSPISSGNSPVPEESTRSNISTSTSHNIPDDPNTETRSDTFEETAVDISPIGPRVSSGTGLDRHYENSEYFSYNRARGHESMQEIDSEENAKLDSLYTDTLNSVLRQSLADCEIQDNFQRWMSVLRKALMEVNKLKISDTLDIRQYVKLKKILGGKIEQTEIVNGLFITKDVDSKKMRSEIEKPLIALLMFPVEYLKDREQFISLRIIHAQQSVYITNLVSKLISLSPDVIVVGDTVCGLAIKLLEEAGITVVSNVKPQVIERISRYTNADIFQSVNDLFFKKGKLGICEKFEVKRFRNENFIKSFVCFTGTDIESGFTIVLRGGDEPLLESIKYTAEVLVHGYLNARYEKSFLRNILLTCKALSLDQTGKDVDQKVDEVTNDYLWKSVEPVLDNQEVLSYIESFKTRRLSLSPSVQYILPSVLTRVVESYYQYFQGYKLNEAIQKVTSMDQVDPRWKDRLRIAINVEDLPGKDKDFVRILKCTCQTQLKVLLDEYQSRARTWSNCLKYSSYQLFPIFHRNIYLLHSTVSIRHATPCAGPAIALVDYYTENDKCLGLFLDQIFSDSGKTCNECGELSLDHYKTYVHGNAKIDLITEKYDIRFNSSQESQGRNQRVMWSYCKQCNYVTPIMAMSDDTYYLSIGRFFELYFYGRNVFGGCEHEYFQNYVQCFGFNDLVIKLEYSKIDNYEIVVPKKRLEFISDININLKVESYKSIKSKADAFFDSVLKRLSRVKLDTFVKAEDGTKKVNEMKDKLAEDSAAIYNKLKKKYDEISVTRYLELNSIFKDLQVLGILWDIEFQEFEKKYLPNESEVNKITQFHLRKFLMDKYSAQEEEKGAGKGEERGDEKHVNGGGEDNVEFADTLGDTDGGTSDNPNKVLEVEQGSEVGDGSKIENISDTRGDEGEATNHDTSKEIKPSADRPPVFIPHKPRTVSSESCEPDTVIESKMFPKASLYEPKTNISERISKWEETAADKALNQAVPLSHRGSDSSLKSDNVIPSQNKVIHLANFFDKMYYDQISLEFSKQREFELRRRSKIKAQPILDSKPIVEIYNKIEDVVGSSENEEKRGVVNDNKNSNNGDTKTVEIKDPAVASSQSEQVPKQLDIPEKQSLLKSLTNFWADRSATLWDPLSYPLDNHEHTFADSDVIVREDEPSSLVAFCLSSSDYKQKIKHSFDQSDVVKLRNLDKTNGKGDSGDVLVGHHQAAQSKLSSFVEEHQQQQQQQQREQQKQNEKEEQQLQSHTQQQVDSVDETETETETDRDNQKTDFGFGLSNDNKKKKAQFAKIERKFKQRNSRDGDGKTNQLESILNQAKSNHLKYQFSDGNTNLSCKIFYSEQFEALRRGCGVDDEDFIQSLSRCIKWHSSGGKSGSSFLKTLDNRYIVKELSKSELESFVAIAPFYFKYISQSMFNTLTTAIAKIFGFYQVEIKNQLNGKVLFKMDFLIMENLFYNHKTTRIFDLKGSMRNRHVQQTGQENEVLLDENMIEYIYESPVFVKEQLKKLLRGCLFNDTSFLSAMDVMDYSLVIGIDDELKKLYIGIIDWLRAFTWDKKVENWVKGNNLIGGGKKGKDPTVVTPKQYRIRFREAMERYILEVPDIWYEGAK